MIVLRLTWVGVIVRAGAARNDRLSNTVQNTRALILCRCTADDDVGGTGRRSAGDRRAVRSWL